MFTGAPLCYSDDEAIQRALITEHAADATYRDIVMHTQSERVKEVVLEIMEDEQNHQGRLQGLLIEMRGGEGSRYEACFCAGLQQKDVPEIT
jgi:rubrerythrin